MRSYSISIIALGFSVYSCSNAQDQSENFNLEKSEFQDSIANSFELIDNRTDQERALDALDKIQVSGGGNLYSTFPNIWHRECQGLVDAFKISNEEFEDALIELLGGNYGNLSAREREYLASTSSKAQEEYEVTTCGSTLANTDTTENAAPPRKGTWIIPAILDQRDLIIIW